jgi:hypothetical protein
MRRNLLHHLTAPKHERPIGFGHEWPLQRFARKSETFSLANRNRAQLVCENTDFIIKIPSGSTCCPKTLGVMFFALKESQLFPKDFCEALSEVGNSSRCVELKDVPSSKSEKRVTSARIEVNRVFPLATPSATPGSKIRFGRACQRWSAGLGIPVMRRIESGDFVWRKQGDDCIRLPDAFKHNFGNERIAADSFCLLHRTTWLGGQVRTRT